MFGILRGPSLHDLFHSLGRHDDEWTEANGVAFRLQRLSKTNVEIYTLLFSIEGLERNNGDGWWNVTARLHNTDKDVPIRNGSILKFSYYPNRRGSTDQHGFVTLLWM